jgi:hypothetical protein
MKRMIFLVCAMALAACGELAPERPDGSPAQQDQPAAQDQQPPAQQEQPKAPAPVQTAKRYGWGLPIGDVSPNFNERDVYNHLRDKDCDGAQSTLDEGNAVDGYAWQGFNSPRSVLLAQAAIEFCEGDHDAGKRLFDRAKAMGWSGLQINEQRHAACEIYKSASSLIEQRPRDDFRCPGGEAPKWKQEEQIERVDPR